MIMNIKEKNNERKKERRIKIMNDNKYTDR